MAALLTVHDAAKLTTLSRSSLWRAVRDGRLAPPVRLSPGRVAFKAEDLAAFIEALPRAGGAA